MSGFSDRVRIITRGGDGGAGVATYQKRKGKPRGKPNGGNGGAGGDVILEASADVPSLLRYDRQTHWKAGSGAHGEGELKHGGRGGDLTLSVPLGTVVRTEDGTLLADLVEPGQRLAVARGGRGGRGNAAFVTVERRAPNYAEQGEFGREVTITLELKLLADAALIGYPNAGKSTFISRVSAARPKIAEYPFTTLEPHLGVVTIGEREFVLADIPGLIEGAAAGKGLGLDFLRHTERARALVILLDPTEAQEDDWQRQLSVLRSELEAHSPDLATRPQIVLMNKADTLTEPIAGGGEPIHTVSAATGEGVDTVLHRIADLVDTATREAPDREGFILHRPLGEGFAVHRSADGWEVTGIAAERAINLDDLTNPEAAAMAARRLARIGVDDALRTAGAQAGDDVRIGSLVFTFDPDAEGANA